MTRKRTSEEFIEKAILVHGNVYDYSLVEYTVSREKVKIICPTHGIFELRANDHIQGTGCKKCSIERQSLSKESFIKKSCRMHNKKYDYSLVLYSNNWTKVKIICSIHGVFEQRPQDHLKGCGCKMCNQLGGYNETTFSQYPEMKKIPSFLYSVELIGKNEHFIKIGITINRLSSRMKYINGYKRKPLFTKNMSLYDAFRCEQELLNKLKKFQYIPSIKFKGYTECFKVRNEVLNEISLVAQ